MKRCSLLRRRVEQTEVVVIGNGPAGLSLSAFLSGILPFYDSLIGHPDEEVHRRLTRADYASLVDQDLTWYEKKMMDISDRAMGHLYDSLSRPSVDQGLHLPSPLRFHLDPSRAVPHIVLGATPPGGSWATHDPEMVAVSVGGLLDLPAFPMAAWLDEPKMAVKRQTAARVAAYMAEYPARIGIEESLRPGTTVTRVAKRRDGRWLVEGVDKRGRAFAVVARTVVMATGLMEPRRLEVEGESGNDRVVYNMQEMKQRLPTAKEGRVVVVGDGVSAADAVLHCIERGRRVLHVMRKNEQELRRFASALQSRFSPSLYPEYVNVFQLMQGRAKHSLYERSVDSRVEAISGGEVRVRGRKTVTQEPFSLLAVCIGQRSTSAGLLPPGTTFGRDYRSEEDPSLFCVGSAVGDHFVRFLVGGCMHVAQQIIAEREGGRYLVEVESESEGELADVDSSSLNEAVIQISSC